MVLHPRYQNAEHFKNFWKNGNGRQLLEWAGLKEDLSDFDQFAHLYYQFDELGDGAVKETYLNMSFQESHQLIQKFSEKKISENDKAPENLKHLLFQMQVIPQWFDENLANQGARFCMRCGTNALIILRDFTLMGGYDFAYLNKPLIFTGALKKGAVKRLKDTLEFWFHVTRENALQINSEAYKLIVKTRLMHSYARVTLKKKIKNWDYKTWGAPINSWDMIATYIGFTLVFMQGLQKLGIRISEQEELGLYHLWKYVGFLLGIPENYLPENRQQAVKQLYLWSSIQAEGDTDSAELAKALLQENLENTIYPYQFQRNLLLKLHQSMNWFLLDEEVNERLKIPKVKNVSFFPKLIIELNIISQKFLDLNDARKYQKLVEFGHKNQMKVLKDYLEHTPQDFQY